MNGAKLERAKRAPYRSASLRVACLLAGLLEMACTGEANESSDSSTGGVSSSSAQGGGMGAGTSGCSGSPVVAQKRVVRLTEHQLFSAYGALFGADAAATIAEHEQQPSLLEREFPPISGDIGVSDALFGKYDRLARSAMNYVSRNATALTPCGASPSDKACVQTYLLDFAERAFRHPLSRDEQVAITGQFWSEMSAAGATLAQALGYGVYGVLSSPSFIYRTEFGTEVASDGPLTPHELATTIALFLTDRPPDAELLAAAASNRLSKPDQLRAQATRLLMTTEARANLENALIKYFSLGNAPSVSLNPEVTPGLTVTAGLQASIFHEGELFLRKVLWAGPLGHLLTARQTWTNAAVATQVYGVAAPSETDADGFGPVLLPADRAGLLTLSTFLLSGARSTGSSPVVRGLAVNRSVVCGVNPAFPKALNPETGELEPDPQVGAAIAALADESELEKANYRASTTPCAGCHLQFDAFGMVLEPYDAVGRFRTTDSKGRAIDSAWTTTTLPRSVGGAEITSVAEAARVLVERGALDRCMAMNFINYALTEVSRGSATASSSPTDSCAVQNVMNHFVDSDRSFTSLMREIVASETLGVRSKGQ